MFVCAGLVPEPSVQRAAHETAQRAGRAAARVLQESQADADAGGPAGARGAHPQRPLLVLWRSVYDCTSFVFTTFCRSFSQTYLRFLNCAPDSTPPPPLLPFCLFYTFQWIFLCNDTLFCGALQLTSVKNKWSRGHKLRRRGHKITTWVPDKNDLIPTYYWKGGYD